MYHDRFLGFANFGGYSDYDIKIYGHHRMYMSYEYMTHLKSFMDKRLTLRQSLEYIADAHKSVQPIRFESKMTIYPLKVTPALGINISYIYGHDNYNFRFVDSGHQLAIGLSWNQFPKTPMINDL